MKLIGDLHGISKIPGIMRKLKGKTSKIPGIADQPSDEVLCVGDVGLGFPGIGDAPSLSSRFWFIRGNHDKPLACKHHPQFALDYGMWRGMFLIGGARSVDKEQRTEFKNWWRDEELSYQECSEALELYREAKPRIVVSHDCPFSMQQIMKAAVVRRDPALVQYGEPRPYNQTTMMDEMLKIHEPEYWFFGHWHISIQFKIRATQFRCLECAEVVDVPS